MPIKKTPTKRVRRAKATRPEGKALAMLCAKAVMDKKAEEPVILDIGKLTSITDYFVICHGTSSRQVQAIADNVREEMRKAGVKRISEEGFTEGRWVLIDAGDVVVHIFDEPVRKFYDLEKLWIHGEELDLPKG